MFDNGSIYSLSLPLIADVQYIGLQFVISNRLRMLRANVRL